MCVWLYHFELGKISCADFQYQILKAGAHNTQGVQCKSLFTEDRDAVNYLKQTTDQLLLLVKQTANQICTPGAFDRVYNCGQFVLK